jgi:dihydroorotate dehydrogenase
MGGVQSGRDALDLLAVGADLVAVGTESFRDPAAGGRVAAELSDALAKCQKTEAGENPLLRKPLFWRITAQPL